MVKASEGSDSLPPYMFSLKHKVELFVPSRKMDGTNIDESTRTSVKRSLGALFASTFGGASVSEILGFFQHASGAMATEQVSVVWSFVADIDEETRAMLEAKASELKSTLAQESVMFTIDGEAFFV